MIFAKAPVRGRVKTRLIGHLSAREATQLHLCCLADTIRLVHRVAERLPSARKFLYLTPPARRKTISRLRHQVGCDPAWVVARQRGPDLGGRMHSAISSLLRSGARKVVIVGTDTPWMGVRRIIRAIHLLDRAEIVLGPADDGGYYLLGARRAVPEMFVGIPWGTSRVFARTLKRLKQAGATYRLLPRDFDLDRPADLRRAQWRSRRDRQFPFFLRTQLRIWKSRAASAIPTTWGE